MFFKTQANDNDIPDGAINSKNANAGYAYLHSDLAPGWSIHKNTIETDQESSLIQAVKKYVHVTGDKIILDEKAGDRTVIQRMEATMKYLLKEWWLAKYGLIKGSTAIDWGDVQPQNGWGVVIDNNTKWTIDIYDNTMFVSAISDFMEMKSATCKSKPIG
ncbi:hypothetical protein NAF17_04020 [Mucilaginibacter sp. RB4R14]|uniref:hypothetical protein n=1 Tax=Mucilaginibacter aurantiaciroseus TaxID=2949308 RepID=UPI002091245A|nr:hypothetical protein [Mucilaginibacter aurantiaciroseus]MCO5934697.1 hypothetical protein [Mucilaginibacter aurantiaciroseus]